jgi:hypothetical protein
MQAWKHSVSPPFTRRTKDLAGSLKAWSKKKKPLQDQVNQLEKEIEQIQMAPPEEQDHNKEGQLTKDYEETMTKLTQYYKQRAKKHWATFGDRNTRFFHIAALKRRRRNRINSIRKPDGQVTFDPQQIASHFISFYEKLFTSTNTSISRNMHDVAAYQIEDEFTNSVPTKDEIWSILKDMKSDASPGLDGLNVAFLRLRAIGSVVISLS